ncbi:MAG: FAD/NAD(P)-binding oxidoreductase [Rhodothermales bacterium]
METTRTEITGESHVGIGVGRTHHEVVIIGGGTGGITVASQLLRAREGMDIAVIEPSTEHYYQPLWTLVGGGIYPKERSRRSEISVMPDGVEWIRERATHVDPDRQIVETGSGRKVGYDFLVVAPGLTIDWGGVKGLKETVGRNGVCSIYDYEQAEVVSQMLHEFEGGEAYFTSPATPIKCGGAPQKIMWLADDLWRRRKVRDRTEITFATAGTVIFGVPGFKEALEELVEEREIHTLFEHHLVEIRPEQREAVFAPLAPDGETEVRSYDLLHVTPPMKAPDFVSGSTLAHAEGESKGWMNVDIHTLQHPDYPNVFGVGDVAALPTAKTGAAVRKQAPVVAGNLLRVADGGTLGDDASRYDGYSSCPIVTGYGRLILAEFGYDNEPMPTFPFDQTKERRSMYILKKYGLPPLYWNLMLKGRA